MSFLGKGRTRALPRTLAVIGTLAVAGFLAAVGAAQVSHTAQTTTTTATTGTTATGTTTTSSTSTSTTTTSSAGCPSGSSTTAVAASDVQPPSRLQIASFATTPTTISGGFQTFTALVKVTDTCGQPVSGANVYVTATPYNQVTIETGTTASDGTVTLTFTRLSGFPADSHQRLMVFFVRATRTGDSLLAGISTRRLVSVHVHL